MQKRKEKFIVVAGVDLVYLYTNSPAEGHVHSVNEVMNLLFCLLMCCILHILYNGDAMDDCDGLIYYGIDGIEFLDVQLMHLLVQKILQYVDSTSRIIVKQ